MYTLLSGFWKYISQRDEYYVLILGLDNAGKTICQQPSTNLLSCVYMQTYLEQTKTKFTKGYKALNPHKITTTVGLNIGKIDIHGIRLNFWDLGGQDSLQSLWDKYYAESHAVIYVVDSSNASRIEESKAAFAKMIGNDALHGVPVLIVANKQDISGCYSAAEIRQLFRESSHLIGRRDCHLIGASALHGGPGLQLDRKDSFFAGKALVMRMRRTRESGSNTEDYTYNFSKETPKRALAKGINEGIEWITQCVKRNVLRPSRNSESL